MNGDDPGYEECLRACPGATAMFRLPLERWNGADIRDRRILTAARALKRADSKKAAPSANQVYKACSGVYCKRYVEKTMRRIREQHLLDIEKPEHKEMTMSMTMPAVNTVRPNPSANTPGMLEGLMHDYLSLAANAAACGDRVTYTFAVERLADDRFTGMYFTHKKGKE